MRVGIPAPALGSPPRALGRSPSPMSMPPVPKKEEKQGPKKKKGQKKSPPHSEPCKTIPSQAAWFLLAARCCTAQAFISTWMTRDPAKTLISQAVSQKLMSVLRWNNPIQGPTMSSLTLCNTCLWAHEVPEPEPFNKILASFVVRPFALVMRFQLEKTEFNMYIHYALSTPTQPDKVSDRI